MKDNNQILREGTCLAMALVCVVLNMFESSSTLVIATQVWFAAFIITLGQKQ